MAQEIKKIYEENLSGWRAAMMENNACLEDFVKNEDRLGALKRLAESGLPTYEFHFFGFEEFFSEEKRIMEIYERYEGRVVARAMPASRRYLQRYCFIDKPLHETKISLNESIAPESRKDYTIVLNEYEPAHYCGIMLSEQDKLSIEMVREPNLENLAHGHCTPWHAEFTAAVKGALKAMRYKNVEAPEERQNMWNAVKSISSMEYGGAFPYYEPRCGYFEFVISDAGRIKFIDYKPGCLKGGTE